MPCYHPITAYKSRVLNENGKREISFNPNGAYSDLRVELPCGRCIGCRLERSRQWAIRCMHEASLHDENSFITLTYSPEQLPEGETLVLSDMQKFIKRLRKSYSDKKIRYFACGEYGDNFKRPHYHVLLFGFRFDDEEVLCKGSYELRRSDELERLWPFGFCSIGDVTFESAAYVARYCLKKITGEKADEHYQGRQPEFTTMSRRPGIGRDWLQKFESDVYPSDEVVVRGKHVCRPPRYYDQVLEKEEPAAYREIKAARQRKQKLGDGSARLNVIERCVEARIKRKGRGYEA